MPTRSPARNPARSAPVSAPESPHPRAAHEVQQLFYAYAAHELRGEIALQLTLAEAALADTAADMAVVRELAAQVAAGCERQANLLDALLTLARSEHAQLRREPLDLAAIAAGALQAQDIHQLTCTTALADAATPGDPQLIERLIANLVENSVRHNLPGGRLEIATYTAAGRATFTIANSGIPIPASELGRLFEPFQRLRSDRRRREEGVGLGLAIVQAIADAHGACLIPQAPPSGGLRIEVAFPALK